MPIGCMLQRLPQRVYTNLWPLKFQQKVNAIEINLNISFYLYGSMFGCITHAFVTSKSVLYDLSDTWRPTIGWLTDCCPLVNQKFPHPCWSTCRPQCSDDSVFIDRSVICVRMSVSVGLACVLVVMLACVRPISTLLGRLYLLLTVHSCLFNYFYISF